MQDTVLASRQNSGLVVKLHYGHGKTSIAVEDGSMPAIIFPVEPENAYDAFYHPFVYMPRYDHETWKVADRERQVSE